MTTTTNPTPGAPNRAEQVAELVEASRVAPQDEQPSATINGATILGTVYPDPVWIVPGLIPTGFTVLAGRPKIGKSWLALQICQAVAAGGKLFDQDIDPGRVLYLALEDNNRRLQERMNKQQWTPATAANVEFMTMDEFRQQVGPLHKTGFLVLTEMIRAGGFRLVIIDTLSRAFIGLRDVNDNQEVTAALDPLQSQAMLNDFALLVLDHHTKPKGYDPNPIDDIMGSTAKATVLDTAIGIYRDQERRVRLMAEGRDIDKVDITLKFDGITGCWQNQGETTEYIGATREKEVFSVLQGGGEMTLPEIAKATNQPKSHTSDRLGKLVEKRLVIRLESGSKISWKKA